MVEYTNNQADNMMEDDDDNTTFFIHNPIINSNTTLRVATYNILNTKDRYTEREELLKETIHGLNADVIGL